ncbi:MAG: sigma-70 family RNA polymerase sigma factor [Akkermansiaceae bacterium]
MAEKRSSNGEQRDESLFIADLTSHQGAILGYLNTLLPGDPDVADIAQRTSVVLWEKRRDFKKGTNFKAWALSVAYWEARAWMTQTKRKSWLIFNEELVEKVTDRALAAPDRPASSDHLDALRHCLSKLSESDRLLVMTHYQHDRSLAECSRILGRSRDALKMALFRLRAGLRRCIESELALRRTLS